MTKQNFLWRKFLFDTHYFLVSFCEIYSKNAEKASEMVGFGEEMDFSPRKVPTLSTSLAVRQHSWLFRIKMPS